VVGDVPVKKRLKIAVYTIAKDEESNAASWASSCADADLRLVLDTGSRDRTVSLLRAHGVRVESALVTPWRFDVARNLALELVPADVDVCVSLDLDETLSAGWREAIEEAWLPGTTQLTYPDIRALRPDGSPERILQGFKVHGRHDCLWVHGIHEVLSSRSAAPVVRRTERFHVTHRPDPSKARGYLELIQRLIQDEPAEPLYLLYLGQELTGLGRHAEASERLAQYLQVVPPGIEPQRRSRAHFLLAWNAQRLRGGPNNESLFHFMQCVAETPLSRDAWFQLACEMANLGSWPNALGFICLALRLTDRAESWLNYEDAWGSEAERLLEAACARMGLPAIPLSSLVPFDTRRDAFDRERYHSSRDRLALHAMATPLEAIAHAFRRVAADPDRADSWAELGTLCSGLGEWPLALAGALSALHVARPEGVDRAKLSGLSELAAERLAARAGARLQPG
jgi:tetratricopeptide (TPR) repeat protein